MQIWNVQKFITSYNIIYYKYLKTRINFISFHLQIYDSVRVKHPSVLNRIHPVHGDVSLPNLDLSPENRIMLIEKVNIVFHIAATVKFNEPLNVAVNINTAGTARIIQLRKELKHVISITYVSTAYSNANLSEIGEKVYT